MNVLVCGTKDAVPRAVAYEAIEESGFDATSIGSPGTAGASQAAITYAYEKGLGLKIFGPLSRKRQDVGLRNNTSDMEEWTEAIVVVGENPPETAQVLEYAQRKALPIYRKAMPS